MAATGVIERDDLVRELGQLGRLADGDIPIGEAALLLAAWDRPRVPLERYRDHLDRLSRNAQEALIDISSRSQSPISGEEVLGSLSNVIHQDHGYAGDDKTYDDLQNANLMRVIDRRKGLPVALGILYLHLSEQIGESKTGKVAGWRITGLNFPGHFVMRLETSRERLIFDPFNAGRLCPAQDLRDLLKQLGAPSGDLQPHHTDPVSKRDILLRLQNNIKIRRLGTNDLSGALDCLATMKLVAPEREGLLYESAVLQANTGNLRAAIGDLEEFLTRGDHPPSKQQAALLLQELKSRLN